MLEVLDEFGLHLDLFAAVLPLAKHKGVVHGVKVPATTREGGGWVELEDVRVCHLQTAKMQDKRNKHEGPQCVSQFG